MNILWRSKRIIMLLYTCFRFSEVMNQMFLTVRCAVQGSFMATLGAHCSLCLRSCRHDQDGELGDVLIGIKKQLVQ